MTVARRPGRNVVRFFLVWFGQSISLLGSQLTGFALGVWVYRQTEMATPFALTLVSTSLPLLLLAPVAGSLVDRWNRKLVLILSDTGAGLATLVIAGLFLGGRLEVWHVYVATATSSAFSAFQWPAYMATCSLLLPKEQLTRANGLTELSYSLAQILAPLLGGVLLLRIGLLGVVLIDVSTFFASVAILLFLRLPEIAGREESDSGGALGGARYALGYLWKRPPLAALLGFVGAANFLLGVVMALAPPLVLSFASADVLGRIMTLGGVGMLVGSLMMSAWGGPERRIIAIIGALPAMGVAMVVASVAPTVGVLSVCAFGLFACIPVVNSTVMALLQSKVANAVQGRVFAVARAVSWSTLPFAYLVAGPLADYVFAPLMAPGGALGIALEPILGRGAGREITVLFLLTGLGTFLVTALATLSAGLRRIDDLPDAEPAATSTGEGVPA